MGPPALFPPSSSSSGIRCAARRHHKAPGARERKALLSGPSSREPDLISFDSLRFPLAFPFLTFDNHLLSRPSRPGLVPKAVGLKIQERRNSLLPGLQSSPVEARPSQKWLNSAPFRDTSECLCDQRVAECHRLTGWLRAGWASCWPSVWLSPRERPYPGEVAAFPLWQNLRALLYSEKAGSRSLPLLCLCLSSLS